MDLRTNHDHGFTSRGKHPRFRSGFMERERSSARPPRRPPTAPGNPNWRPKRVRCFRRHYPPTTPRLTVLRASEIVGRGDAMSTAGLGLRPSPRPARHDPPPTGHRPHEAHLAERRPRLPAHRRVWHGREGDPAVVSRPPGGVRVRCDSRWLRGIPGQSSRKRAVFPRV
jgi:hypothetical protein